MANAFKVLYQGQLGNTVGTLATVGGGKSWIVKSITAVNTDSSVRTFGLCINGTGAANRITSAVISLPASGGYWISDDTYVLDAGATLAGGASVASKVTVTVTGDEVS